MRVNSIRKNIKLSYDIDYLGRRIPSIDEIMKWLSPTSQVLEAQTDAGLFTTRQNFQAS